MALDLSTMQASPAAQYYNASTGQTEWHLFFPGVNLQLVHAWWDGKAANYQWQYQDLPTSVSTGSDPIVMPLPTSDTELHVFFRGSDGSLQHLWYDGLSWFPAGTSETIAGVPVAPPAVDLSAHYGGRALGGVNFVAGYSGSNPPVQQHVFYQGTDGHLYDHYWNGGAWSTQPALPGAIAGPPTAQSLFMDPPTSTDSYQLNVYFTGTDGRLQLTTCTDGITWTSEPVPNQSVAPSGVPAASSGGAGGYPPDISVFYPGPAPGGGTALWQGIVANGQWTCSEWGSIGLDPVILDCAYDNSLGQVSGGLAWQLNEACQNQPAGAVSWQVIPGAPLRMMGVARFDDGPHAFYLATDGSVQQTWNQVSNWSVETIAPPNVAYTYGYWSPPGSSGGSGCSPAAQVARARVAVKRLFRR
jgi:hypothetical protein